MKHSGIGIYVAIALMFILPVIAHSEPLTITKSDTIEAVLKRYTDARVTVKLKSGEELSGKVKVVTGKLLQLTELSGKEFFDAAVVLDDVSAVIVRVRDK